MFLIKFIMICILSLVSVSCSTTSCKDTEKKRLESNAQVDNTHGKSVKKVASTMNQIKKVKVYKLDGSKQCEQGTGLSLGEMAKQLGDITVFSSTKQHDGLMRTQVCGQDTGQCNVFEISATDLGSAEKLGFKLWKND
ncbi:MAG: hypothetical protein ACK41T_08755 [Pseudobdellovibrio sp.]